MPIKTYKREPALEAADEFKKRQCESNRHIKISPNHLNGYVDIYFRTIRRQEVFEKIYKKVIDRRFLDSLRDVS